MKTLGLSTCLEALLRAKILAFGVGDFPIDMDERDKWIDDSSMDDSRRRDMYAADDQFCLAADKTRLQDLANRFAEELGLPYVMRKLEY